MKFKDPHRKPHGRAVQNMTLKMCVHRITNISQNKVLCVSVQLENPHTSTPNMKSINPPTVGIAPTAGGEVLNLTRARIV